jgi:hypothetical protein
VFFSPSFFNKTYHRGGGERGTVKDHKKRGDVKYNENREMKGRTVLWRKSRVHEYLKTGDSLKLIN